MNCWQYLEIEPTNDKALIKKAYAAKLKKHKPDEDPVGFATLHSCYKNALRLAPQLKHETAIAKAAQENVTPDNNPSVGLIQGDNAALSHIQHHPSEILTSTPQAHSSEDTKQTQNTSCNASRALEEPLPLIDLEAEWKRLTGEVNALTCDTATANNEKLWSFLEGTEALYDIEFKAYFSSFVFEALLELQKQNPRKKLTIAQALNTIFRWSDRKDGLEAKYGDASVRLLFDQIEGRKRNKIKWVCEKAHRGPKVYGNYYARLFATMIDIFVIATLQYAIQVLASSFGIQNVLFTKGEVLLFLLLYAVIIPIMEASPMQGSIGKVLLGMKVTSMKGNRLNIVHSCWRNLSYLISTACFKVTVWINLFTNDGKMIHDRASRSLVLRR